MFTKTRTTTLARQQGAARPPCRSNARSTLPYLSLTGTLMLVKHNAQSVVISGASSGLGRALALQYAIPERSLGLLGRDKARLAEVAAACRDRGANVTTGAFDLIDCMATGSWMRAYDADHPIDLL